MNKIWNVMLVGSLLVSAHASASRLLIPDYVASYWNNNATTKQNNNCYNYATNKITNNFAQPGWASGYWGFSIDPSSCTTVKNGAIKDSGIYEVTASYDPDSAYNSKYRTLQALVIEPGRDYHWYRRDSNGLWSHKPGSTSVTNLDNSGNLISNPETANRGNYTTFCGYFYSNSSSFGGGASSSNGYQGSGYANISGVFNTSASTADHGEIKHQSMAKAQKQEQKSLVTIFAYSGKENPTLLLSEIDEETQYKISEAVSLLNTYIYHPLMVGEQEQFIESRLGYSGILIEDHEGLYFEKGTSVFMRGDTIKIIHKAADVVSTKTLANLSETEMTMQAHEQTSFTKTTLLDVSIETDLLDMAVAKGLLNNNMLD